MYSLLVLLCCSFILCAVLTVMCRTVCLRFNLVDRPDKTRKLHKVPIPRLGGVAIAGGYAGSILLLVLLGTQGGGFIQSHLPEVKALLPAALVVFVVGLVDDLFNLRAVHKLAGQVLAAVMAYGAGIRINNIGNIESPLWIDFLLTILWILACTNAFNLIDGMDGLAAGLGCFAATTTFVASLLQDNFALAMATLPLVGCLLAFLLFNFNPASIFLGDSGSLLIGFLLGCYAVTWSQKTATIFGIVAPLMALAIPLIDTSLAIVRRSLRNRPIFSPDRGHIHHLLLDRGLTPKRAALLLYGFAGLGAALSLLAGVRNDQFAGLVLVAFGVLVLIGVQALGFAEFEAVKQLFVRRTFQRVLASHIALHSLEKRLAASQSVQDCWELIRDASRSFGFARVECVLSGQILNASFRRNTNGNLWKVTIPLGTDHIDLEHDHNYMGLSEIGPFVDVVSRQMHIKYAANWAMRKGA